MIPNSVNIGGHEVRIIILDQNEIRQDTSACTNQWAGVIQVSNACADSYQEQLVSHEILHQILHKTGAEFHFDYDKKDTEAFISNIENVFWRFLKDNTRFFDDD